MPYKRFTSLEEIGIGSQFNDTLADMLVALSFFNTFTQPEMRQLIRHMHAYKVNPGTILFQEGELDSYLLFLTFGKAEIFKTDHEGTQKKLATVRRGAILGEISILDEFPHSATVISNEASEVVILSRANLQKITETYPALGVKLLWQIASQLGSRLRQLSGTLVDHI